MQPWKTTVLHVGGYRPRQFEYHPQEENVLVFGTLKGETVVADVGRNEVLSHFRNKATKPRHDPILGLCWLRKSARRFIVGSSHGSLRMCDTGGHTGGGGDESGSGVGSSSSSGGSVRSGAWSDVSECEPIVRSYESFDKLTSVHVNASDDLMLASGYSSNVRLYDLETAKVVREFEGIHTDHINISRFSNFSPFLFATSSFDKTVKMWDARTAENNRSIYTCHSSQGHVMLCFSPDDSFLLTSAVDNEVKQYLAVDGRLHLQLDMPRTGLEDNFTRAYYSSSGRLIICGSSEEQVVKLHCTQTGRHIHSAGMYPGRKHNSLYVQSLRGDPHHDFQFSVLVNYRDGAYPLEIVHIDMLESVDGKDLSESTGVISSDRLADDFTSICNTKDHADVALVARNGQRFLGHAAVLSCRSPVLKDLVLAAQDEAIAESSTASPRARGQAAPSQHQQQQRQHGTEEQYCVRWGRAKRRSLDGMMQQQESYRMGEGDVGDEQDMLGGGSRGGSSRMAYLASHEEEPTMVVLPRSVHPDVIPFVLEYLYGDRLNLEAENGPVTTCFRGGSGVERESSSGSGGIVPVNGPDRSCDHTMRGWTKTEWAWAGGNGRRIRRRSSGPVLESPFSFVSSPCHKRLPPAPDSPAASDEKVSRHEGMEQESGKHKWAGSLGYWKRDEKAEQERVLSSFAGSRFGLPPGTSILTLSRLFQAAEALALPRLTTLVEWEARRMVNNETIVVLLALAERATAPQLKAFCMHYLATHLDVVLALHGQDSLPEGVRATLEETRRQSSLLVESGQQGEAMVIQAATGAVEGGSTAEEEQGGGNGAEAWPAAVGGGGGVENEEDEEDEEDDEEEETEGGGNAELEVDDESDSESEEEWGNDVIPPMTGHTCTAVLDKFMVVLGGGNKRQFHSCRHILVLEPTEMTWTKHTAGGTPPSTLIYHSATVLEPPRSKSCRILVFGGTNLVAQDDQARQSFLWVLDALTMTWSRPTVEGETVELRTRHTMVSLHDRNEEEEEMEQEEEEEMEEEGYYGQAGEGATVAPRGEGQGRSGRAVYSRRQQEGVRREGRSEYFVKGPSELYSRDISRDTNLVLFGGYSPAAREPFNTVCVLNVSRVGGSPRRGGSVSEGPAASWRGRGAKDNSHHRDEGSRVGSKGSSPAGEGEVEQLDGNNAHGYRYLWIKPTVRGTWPGPRLAHSAALVHVPASRGGDRMVVFGGVGLGSLFSDTHVLCCGNLGSLRWEEVNVNGTSPCARYGHSMTAIRGSRTVLLFGGTSGHKAFNDVFVMTMSPPSFSAAGPLDVCWTPVLTQGIQACPRSRSGLVELGRRFLVFGGSDEVPPGPGDANRNKEVDTSIYALEAGLIPGRAAAVSPTAGAAAGAAAGAGAGAGAAPPCAPPHSAPAVDEPSASPPRIAAQAPGATASVTPPPPPQWTWTKAQVRLYDAGPEPPVVLHVGRLHCDLQTLLPSIAKTKGGSVKRARTSTGEDGDRFGGGSSGSGSGSGNGGASTSAAATTPTFADVHLDFDPWTSSIEPTTPTNTAHYSFLDPSQHACLSSPTGSSAGGSPMASPAAADFRSSTPSPLGAQYREPFAHAPSKLSSCIADMPQDDDNHAAGGDALSSNSCSSSGQEAEGDALQEEYFSCASTPSPPSSPFVPLRLPGGRKESSHGQQQQQQLEQQQVADHHTKERLLASASSPSRWAAKSCGTTTQTSGSFAALDLMGRLNVSTPPPLGRGGSGDGSSPMWGRDDLLSPPGGASDSPAHRAAVLHNASTAAGAAAEAAAAAAAGGGGGKGRGGGRSGGAGIVQKEAGTRRRNPRRRLSVHRMILSLRSPPLRAMLLNGWQESVSDVVYIREIRRSVFLSLLTYLYTDTLRLDHPNDIMELLVAANQYSIDNLVALCVGYLWGVLDHDNAASIYHYSDALQISALKHSVLAFITREYATVCTTEGYHRLPATLTAEVEAYRQSHTHAYAMDQRDHTHGEVFDLRG